MKKEQTDILKEAFEEWLQIHDLDNDFWICTGDERRARGEEVLQKADGFRHWQQHSEEGAAEDFAEIMAHFPKAKT